MSSGSGLRLAVVGATGAVGEVALELMSERWGRSATVHALASEHSVGREVGFGRQSLVVDDLATFDFSGVDFALFCAGSTVSIEHVPRAVAAGAWVVDNSAAFRNDPNIPLVVPEVNPDALTDFRSGIVANPNCSTIQMVMALAPIHRLFGLQEIVVSTYQAVSGAGKAAMEELGRQAVDRFNFRQPKPEVFNQPIGFNVIPMIDALNADGFSKEEMKMVDETRRLLASSDLAIHATAVRVPVFTGHAESIYVRTDQPIDVDRLHAAWAEAPGVRVTDAQDPATPLTHGANEDAVWVSRVRPCLDHDHGLMLWVVADNLRKGAALNAVQIIEALQDARRPATEPTH